MLFVLVDMKLKEGCMDQFLQLGGELREKVLAEEGCISYDYARDIASPTSSPGTAVDPNRITLVERWESQEALNAHSQSPHMKEYGPKMGALRESVTISVHEKIFD